MSLLWEKIVRPLMFRLEAETAHELGMKGLRSGITRAFVNVDELSQGLSVERFGLRFKNPLGMAAGFDKNGLVVDQLASLGFGFVEVGTVTYEPQPGNEKPRLFRLPKDKALINRLGFNNEGARAITERLGAIKRRCTVGINIGKNRSVPNEEAVENYLKVFEAVYQAADYIAVNISSPNTPDLRELQRTENLGELIGALQERNSEMADSRGNADVNERDAQDPEDTLRLKPLLVKIAPDLSESEIEAIVGNCIDHQIDGIIATNTTVSREGLLTPDIDRFGAGGLSGKPLEQRSTEVIATVYKYSKGKLPIIGVGGIFTAEDAFTKIAAGASLVQAYTGFVYGGPRFAANVLTGLRRILEEKGFATVDEAVGSGLR